jgi:hypothetical protein
MLSWPRVDHDDALRIQQKPSLSLIVSINILWQCEGNRIMVDTLGSLTGLLRTHATKSQPDGNLRKLKTDRRSQKDNNHEHEGEHCRAIPPGDRLPPQYVTASNTATVSFSRPNSSRHRQPVQITDA